MNDHTKHVLLYVGVTAAGFGLIACGSRWTATVDVNNLDRHHKDPCTGWVEAFPGDPSGIWYRYRGPERIFWNPDTGSFSVASTAPECSLAPETPATPAADPTATPGKGRA